MVPLQQYDGFNPSEAPSLTPCVHRPQQLPLHPLHPLPLLPLRFLLPKEMDLASHYLNKHMRVIQTHTGSWFAEYQQNRTMNYVKEVSQENHQEAEAVQGAHRQLRDRAELALIRLFLCASNLAGLAILRACRK